MQQLAAAIRKDIDLLVDRYDAGLRNMPGYDRLPEALRRDLERHVLELIAQCMDTSDHAALVQYVQQRAAQWESLGFPLAWFQQALIIPEEILTPLISSVDASNFLWQALNRSQSVVWQMVADRALQTEQALQTSQTQYQTIFDATPIMFWLKDTHNRTLRINQAAAIFEGVSPADVEGKSAFDLYPHEQAEAFYQDDLAVIQSGQPKLGIIEQHTSVGTGKMMWVETGKVPVRNEQGEISGVLAFGVDVTARKQLELQAQESLTRRSIQVQTSIEVAQHIAAAPELEELLHRVVTLVKERFNYYHAQLFRYVPAEDAVELITGYGEVGQKMLAAGHKLAMGRGVVGTAAATGQSILATDVARDLDWRPNPNLPDTKGELAVPIKLGSGDAESQAHALKHFTNGSYDGIVVAAIDPEAIARITHEFLQHGKPVVAVSCDLGQENQIALIYAIEHEVGYLLGVQAGTWAQEHLPNSPTVKVGVLTYRALPNVVERERGIIDGIQSVIGERVTIVATESAIEPKEAAYLTEGWLRNHPDLNMIVAYNDATALGAYQAAQNAGWHDPDQFFIGGIDAVPEALDAIQQGGVYQATVNQPPEVMGIMAVRTLVAAIKGLPVKPINTLYCAPVNRSNAAEFSGRSREATVLVNQDIIPAEALSGFEVSGLRLGLSVLTLANPFFATLAASAQREAQRLGVQLVINDPSRVLGVLDVQSDRANTLTDDDRLLLEGLCGQIASAMESTRLLEQLRRGEAQLSEALKIAKLGYWEYDVEKDLFLFNDQFYALFHTTVEQEGGYQLSSAQYAGKFVHPDDLPIVGTEIERALNSTDRHYSRDLVHRILYADGGVGYISVSINIDRDEQGKILRYYGANQDITERQLAEEAVRHSEAQLSEALKIAKLANWEYDVERDRFHFNDQFYSIFHTTAEQAGGYQLSSAQYAQQFVHPDDLPLVGSEIEKALNSTDRHYNRLLEHRVLYADGGVGYISVNVNIDRDEQGKILRYYGANQDITERKQIEDALRQNEAQLSEALKIAKLAYWEYDVERDRFHFNDQFYSIFHTTAEQAGGYQLSSAQYAQQFVHPDDLPLVGTEIERALNSTDQHYSRDLVHRILYADGGVGYISVNINIDRDEQGKILRYYGANQDITERKLVEEALAQEQSNMRALMDSITDQIYFKDLQSRFLRVSQSQAKRFSLSDPQQATGKTDFDFFTEEHARPAYEDEQEIIRTGQPLTKEERETWTDRPDTWVLTTKFPLRDEAGHIVGTFGRSVDITERKQIEAERERLLTEQQRRAVQLQTASEVSRAASSILNLDELLPQTVELIRTRFELYYVGIFLLDETEQWAILRAGTGEAGHIMLANNHRLEIGGNSMISQCVVTQRARIALDVGEEAVRFDNPLLPLTRSEMALPLVRRGRIIGAMTIQSDQSAAFTADDVTALQSMADQIGNTVENARLYAQTQAALGDTDRLLQASAELNVSQSYTDVLGVVRKYTVLGQQALTIAINVFDRPWTESQTPVWIEVVGYYTKRSSGIDVGTRFPIAMFPSAKSLLRSDAPSIIENFDTAQVDPNTYALFVQRFASKSVIFMPLVVGGQWFGYLNVLYSNPSQFDEADVRRLMAMVGQAAVAVQNLRNFAAAQQTLTETEASYRATQAIGRAESVEGILEATIHVVDLIGMTRSTLRVVSRRDVNNTVMATDIYAYHRLDGQWVLQPVAKDMPVSDITALKSLQRNPDAVVIYADAQNPNSAMPDEMRQVLLVDQLRGSISTSVSLQNEVLGFLSFSGPQALSEAAEQRLRIAIRTLSDQVAVALQNRLLFEQTRAALQEVDAINRRLTGEAWDTYLRQQTGREVIWLADDDAAAPEALSQLDEQLTTGEITIEPDPEDSTEATVTAPILLRGQPIGALRLRTPLSEWDDDNEAMLADIAGHVAQAVENARLVEQTQRTAQRERTINEINARVRQTVTIDSILETAVKELGKSLTATHIFARVSRPETEENGHDQTG